MQQHREMKDGINLRLPDGLRPALKEAAARNRRSMNAEAVVHLERGLAAQETASEPTA